MTFEEKVREAFALLVEKETAELMAEDIPETEESDRFKRNINRLFRERVGAERIPHPEVDNTYERLRSRIVRYLLVAVNQCR